MKKLLSLAVVSLALCGLFVSCASTGSSSKAAGPGIPHPRSYDVDPGAVTTSAEIGFNQYGPNYQGVVDFWKLLKKNKPQAGDTVNVKMKFTSNLDIPGMAVFLLDNGAPSYWTPISDDYFVEDIKAGEPKVFEASIPLTKNAAGGFQIVFAYDGADHGQNNYAKAGKAATFTFEQIGEMTDTEAEMLAAGVGPTGPRTIEVVVEKIAAYCEIATNHPWVNGVQDMSRIENYANTVSLDTILDDVVSAGDKIHLTWRGVSDKDIDVLYGRPVDHSQSVGWWNELITFDDKSKIILAEDIKAGEPFTVDITWELEKGSETTDVIINIWYDYDPETNGPGPSVIMKVRE